MLRKYLRNDYKLPKFESIVQVNSAYCEPIQMIDLIFKAMKQNKLDKNLIINIKEKRPRLPYWARCLIYLYIYPTTSFY